MPQRRDTPRWGLWIAAALLVLPVLYVLSVGPALLAWERGWISSEALEGV